MVLAENTNRIIGGLFSPGGTIAGSQGREPLESGALSDKAPEGRQVLE